MLTSQGKHGSQCGIGTSIQIFFRCNFAQKREYLKHGVHPTILRKFRLSDLIFVWNNP